MFIDGIVLTTTLLVSGSARAEAPAAESPAAEAPAVTEAPAVEASSAEAGVAEAPATGAVSEGRGRLLGRVRTAGERVAVERARVAVIPGSHPLDATRPPEWTRRGVTDAEGRFTIEEIPAGSVRVVVLHEAHERVDAEATVVREADVALELYAPRAGGPGFRTVVAADRSMQQQREARSTALSREEVRTLPGTQGDALRALQNLPGVARPPGGLGLLVLRGAPPWQSLTMLGEHPVPRAFHSLPFAAIVQAQALDGVELLPGNASARYGPLTGGVVQLHPHRPRRDAVHGHGELDVTGVNASIEGPVGLGSYMVAMRRGWLDAVLLGVEQVVPNQAFMLPGLWDYQAMLVLPVVGDGELELRALGAGDRVRSRFYSTREQAVIDTFAFGSQFHRFDLVGRWSLGRARLLLSPTVRIGQDRAMVAGYVDELRRRELVPGWRAELETRIAPRASLVLGTDGSISPFRTRLVYSPVWYDGAPDGARWLEATGGAYAIAHLGTDRWRLSPGVRAQGFLFGDARRAALDPRVGARVAVSDRVTLDLGLGRYSQLAVRQLSLHGNIVDQVADDVAPTVLLPSALVASFEPRVPLSDKGLSARVVTATQASASAEVELPWELELRVGSFVRHSVDPGRELVLDGLAPRPGERVTGLDYGGELLLRRRLTRSLYGWIAYTFMRSVRRGPEGEVVGDFDQPHNLVAVLSHRLPRGWRLGGRFRVTSGNPYRPVVGVAELDEDDAPTVSTPVFGADNSARFPTFHQLDLRVDKQWILPRATITGYLDVQNVYNRRNVEAWVHQPDYRGLVGAFGLPILPIVGLRVDY
jgi:hypothetical protein